MMKILVVGGGTAGHISPVLAVIESLYKLRPELDVLFVCDKKNFQIDLLNHYDIKYQLISSGKYRRYGRGINELLDFKTQIQNAKDLYKIAQGYFQARKIIKQFRPDAVFIKGGYVGLPVGLAAVRLRVPIVLHESDIVMGKTNQILAKFARAIAVSFPLDAYKKRRYQDKFVLTGNPVRSEFENIKQSFTKSEQKPNVFIFAGSQGAGAINKVIFENLELLAKQFNILHLTGEGDIERARYMRHRLPSDISKNYEPHSFLRSEMVSAYHWADIIVSRGGMNSLTEIAAMAKPAIIIPLPHSTGQHQLKNAQYLARMGAVRLLLQDDLSGVKLAEEISKLYYDKSACKYLAKSIHKFYIPDSSKKIAALILGVAEGKGNYLETSTSS